MTWVLLALSLAHALTCEFGHELKIDRLTYKQCEITGHAGSEAKPVYYAHCALQPDDRQIEFAKGEISAHWIDPASRKEAATCKLKSIEVTAMIQAYTDRAKNLEKPKCVLTQSQGQLALANASKLYRCSFKMKDALVGKFTKATGVKPAFQCEGQHFLVTASQDVTNAFEAYGDSWRFLCAAAKQIGGPVESIDWAHPPVPYDPTLD